MKRRCLLMAAAGAPLLTARAFAAGATVLSGDRFMLDGLEYQLADVFAPPLYTFGNETAPFFDEAKSALKQTLGGAALEVEEVAPVTRWGVRIVRACIGETSAELDLVRRGAARVRPRTDDLEFLGDLLAAEQEARAAARGLWALPDYRVYEARDAEPAVGGYNLIEGVVRQAAKSGSRFYLNFGDDFRTDFTAGATSRIYRSWAKTGFGLEQLAGARLRVRGFVENINGPSIDLTHQRQIEMIAPPEA